MAQKGAREGETLVSKGVAKDPYDRGSKFFGLPGFGEWNWSKKLVLRSQLSMANRGE